MPDSPKGLYYCVVDAHPRFQLEVLRFFATVTRLALVDPADLVVFEVDRGQRLPTPAGRFLADEGVHIERLVPFDERSPHLNKLAATHRLAEMGVTGRAVQCDTDLAVLEDARSIDVGGRAIAGRIVDAANPDVTVLGRIFADAGIPRPEIVAPGFQSDGQTVATNLNAGLLVFPGEVLAELVKPWRQWALWLLDRLPEYRTWMAPDQVSLALTLPLTGIEIVPIGPGWNFPTGPVSHWDDTGEAGPSILHYHSNLDRLGLLAPKGEARVDRAIDSANGAVTAIFRQCPGVVLPAMAKAAGLGARKALRRRLDQVGQ